MTVHDATKVLMGSVATNDKTVTNEVGDPTTFLAGLVVRRGATGALQLASDAVAARVGISLGPNLSDLTNKTVVCRAGDRVPIRLKDESVKATGLVTITNYANLLTTTADTIAVAGVVFTAQSGAATLGTATFRAATSNDATAASLAAQINAHATANLSVVATVASAVVTITAVDYGEDGNSIALAYVDVGTGGIGATVSGAVLTGGEDDFDWIVIGGTVKTSATTGEATEDGDDCGAVFLTGPLTGVYPDGTTCRVAYVDMAGGL